jgi:hypothetical protein
MKMINSKSFSFKGWNFSEWLSRNKRTLKDLLTGVLALVTYFATMNNPQWLQVLLTVIIPAIIRLGIDALDYYVSDLITFK